MHSRNHWQSCKIWQLCVSVGFFWWTAARPARVQANHGEGIRNFNSKDRGGIKKESRVGRLAGIWWKTETRLDRSRLLYCTQRTHRTSGFPVNRKGTMISIHSRVAPPNTYSNNYQLKYQLMLERQSHWLEETFHKKWRGAPS